MGYRMRQINASNQMTQEIFQFIRTYYSEHGYMPTFVETADGTGITRATVRKHFDLLVEKGILETEHEGEPRAYRFRRKKNE